MTKLLAIGAFLLLAGQTQANIDVTCFMNNCMTDGWHAYDSSNNASTLVECNNFDCAFDGWVVKFNGREVEYSICKTQGCFEDGWTTYDSRTGQVRSNVTCGRGFTGGRCLEFGWNTFVPNKGTYSTRCHNGDCLNLGWVVRVPGFNPQNAVCKTGGCFSAGWNLRR